MDTVKIELGDIVSLNSHPYLSDDGNILITGEPQQVPPLMVVVEIAVHGKGTDAEVRDYTCLWFSTKTHKFQKSKFRRSYIKPLFKCTETINVDSLKEGDLLSIKTLDYELGKRKATLNYQEKSQGQNYGNTTISALLSFLPPMLHFMGAKVTKEKPPEAGNKGNRGDFHGSRYLVKCLWYNDGLERFSEEVIPIEALKLIPAVNDDAVTEIRSCISHNKVMSYENRSGEYLINPISITARSGYYFLKGYDYVANAIIETQIQTNDSWKILDTPFINAAPQFDIDKDPQSGSAEFILNEIKALIGGAEKQNAYLRIKYKSRNDEVSIRTLKQYSIVEGIESQEKNLYLIGFCMLRQAKRAFKISRIQSVQRLDICFSK